jgi:hypothetical protein
MKKTPVVQYVEYSKIEDFIRDISYGGSLYELFMNGNYAFRGHASDKYKLIPVALRPESRKRFNQFALSGDDEEKKDLEYFQIIKEGHILRDFYKMCDRHGLANENIKRFRSSFLERMDLQTLLTSEMWLPQDLWTLAALAQHYGLPTRLLDWTHDINVGLFFAVEDYLEGRVVPEETKHIVVWALNLQPITEPNVKDMPLKLVQPIYHGNDNLTAQQGLFTLWQVKKSIDFSEGKMVADMKTIVNRKPLDQLLLNLRIGQENIEEPYLYGFLLPADSGREIYRYIKSVGYDASRIYPNYNGVVKSMCHDYYLYKEAIEKSSAIMIARN